MKRFFSIALCIIFIGVFDACAQKLVILHVNDTHSHLEPERSDDLNGRGGFIEISAYVDSVRKAEGRRNVLLLHAGIGIKEHLTSTFSKVSLKSTF